MEPEKQNSNPVGAKYFSFLHSVETGCETNFASCPVGNGAVLLENESAGARI
jgi:hypothetical protein